MSDIKSTNPTNYIQQGHKNINDFKDKADKAIMNAQSFSVFGLRIPKGPFSDKDAVRRLEAAQKRAEDLKELLSELFKTAFAPTVQKG